MTKSCFTNSKLQKNGSNKKIIAITEFFFYKLNNSNYTVKAMIEIN